MQKLGFFGTPFGIMAVLVAVFAPEVYVAVAQIVVEITSELLSA